MVEEKIKEKKTPKTLLEGGPMNGKIVEVVFNPCARIPHFKNGLNDWDDVVYLQYILYDEKKGKMRKAKYQGECV